jgi:hypothetical protein
MTVLTVFVLFVIVRYEVPNRSYGFSLDFANNVSVDALFRFLRL